MKEVTYKTVPAQKAKKVKQEKTLCDICGADATPGRYGSGGDVCSICHREICKKHRDYDPEDWGDYPAKFCVFCYYLKFKKYLADREAEIRRHEEIEDNLESKMKEESLKTDVKAWLDKPKNLIEDDK